MLPSITIYYTILYKIILYSTILYCIILYSTIVYYIIVRNPKIVSLIIQALTSGKTGGDNLVNSPKAIVLGHGAQPHGHANEPGRPTSRDRSPEGGFGISTFG